MAVTDTLNRSARAIPVWVIYILGILPLAYIIFATFAGAMGMDPVKTIEHELGQYAIIFFILTLTITPIRQLAGVNLIRFRRSLGHLTFFYVFLHLLVWLGLDMQLQWGQMWTDILKRPYITIGMVGFVLLLPVMATSNDTSIRRLGAASWRKVQKLVYPAIFLGALHYVMVQKVWEAESMIYMGIVLVLLVYRLRSLKLGALLKKNRSA
ncbi:protein-methionine-sulfoxide reductase heme-binding subunit MsrQ [Litoreibacter roseus]|uniref:Protein-methionine-sulfoxide reductase heme-binding subunit MsrQ n=1 Tax=Litoreibacter roseus TaxID=2601869 RepID=A0A6N6JI06_9RHOB|nr:protein-methionine-sulfoxide reductase heme-binding subunit MsrQ [Litoreibacter roseus]GFE64918.1 protein-methionine-sulfoxide reductase heme-binding subunit MsrQ [Litoreibacter roseus]